ncbi:MAG: Eco57I restriction-modification methylase domain-containing protein [Gemmataceae bacterium]
MAKDPELLAHQQWLGYLQPVGLVVSPPALLQAQAHVSVNVAAEHQRFLDHVVEAPTVGRPESRVIKDLRGLLLDVFGWQFSDLIESADARAAALEVVLLEYHETLRPTYAVPETPLPDGRGSAWLMLIQVLPLGTPLDEIVTADERRWQATPQARFERLLRETQVHIGLLCNGTHLRLVYAPRGETAGLLSFPVQAMTETAGRPVFAALLMLLSAERLFSLPDKQRLPAILADSRKYQNTVSTELAQQVLAALYELLRGFQAADDHRKGDLLREVLARDPDQIYAGLLTVLLRLVFLLYAEDRGLTSDDEVYVKHYSVTGLFERLRGDAGHYPDTMDLRYGAWAQLLALFRLVHNGGRHGKLYLPARHGFLFKPENYPFLEGGGAGIPLVADGVLFRVLQNLLVLDGERISYRSLDVEQIGSVYETIMGFRLEKAAGRSLAIKPAKAHGAPATISLEQLLQVSGKDRGKWLKERTDQALTGAGLNALKTAETPEALAAALERKIARELTPNIVPSGSMVLQPSDERRRSGSHYTPRSLTEPIVRKALEPVLQQLSEPRPLGPLGSGQANRSLTVAAPQQILALKVCDPAMGSGAFLVEACRQLGDALLKAWSVHGGMPKVPDDETPELFAQRTIAQRCLYGVDKNPLAVDLAKLSLWLATLAKDHAFTFLNHALRCGDSLVGLTRQQIVRFHWKDGPQQQMLGSEHVQERLQAATRCRQEILEAGDEVAFDLKQQKLTLADESLNLVRFAGNLAVAAFFAADKDRKRQDRRDELLAQLTEYLRTGNMNLRPTAAERALPSGDKGITPFHWEMEFPEVFGRENGGFECIVGNPPFAGRTTLSEGHREGYLDWLKAMHSEAHGNSDLVAHFFRRAFDLLRPSGTFGLIATNTIAQWDTRSTGLRWICKHGGSVYAARRRYRWPGQAAVVVSIVHVAKGAIAVPYELNGLRTARITAYLFHAGGHDDPVQLQSNAGIGFQGCVVVGMGFTFDDRDKAGIANPTRLMRELIAKNKQNADRIFPYIGGEEVNDSPTQAYHRYVINFGEMSEEEARHWPDLMKIVEERVKPERTKRRDSWSVDKEKRAQRWWQFSRTAKELYSAIHGLERVLVCSQVNARLSFVFLPATWIYAHYVNVFALPTYADFCILQSRVHEIWARFFGSSMKDDLRYTPSDCFETFPFPEGVLEPLPDGRGSDLESAGKEYYEFRADLMVQNNEGLTKTYNRFHDPNERSSDIARLRQLHAAMDRAVLDAYGWTDLQPTCAFLLDYEEDDEEEDHGGRQRKKPWRYRWPDAFRDEVLSRLLELNKQRAEQEALAGAAEKPKKGRGKKAVRRPPESTGLF